MKKLVSLLLAAAMLFVPAAGCAETEPESSASATEAPAPTEAPADPAPPAEPDSAAEPAGGAPAGEAPAGGAPAGGMPAGGDPAGGAPAGGMPAGEMPAGGMPAGGAPAGAPPGGAPGGGPAGTGGPPESVGEIATTQVAETPVEAAYIISYPVSDGSETITVYSSEPALGPLTGRVPIESHLEYETFQRSIEATGVNVELVEVSAAASDVQFNLMVASGEYTDVISNVSGSYSGGFTKAYQDEVIIDLKDIIEENCPDYWKYVAASESILRDTTDDSGAIFGVYSIYDSAIYIEGYLLREDWLNNVGMEKPTSFDEMYDVLTAFKTEYELEAPAFVNQTAVLMNTGYNIARYDVGTSALPMFVDGETVKCTFQEEGYRDWLIMMNQWWEEGLIPRNFMENSSDPFAGDTERLSLNNEIGLFTQMSTSMNTFYENETEGFALTPVVITADGSGVDHMTSDTLVFSSVSLSTQCENPELALQYINWWYTDEGQMCYNYGMEGVHYNLDEDGEVVFTDMVINNEYSVSPTLYMRCFTIAGFGWGRTIQSRNWVFYEDYAADAVNYWTEHNDGDMAMPTLSFTTAESETLAETTTDLCTYVSERVPRFITGELSLDDWDSFVEELEQFRMAETIEIYQAAYDRYLAR